MSVVCVKVDHALRITPDEYTQVESMREEHMREKDTQAVDMTDDHRKRSALKRFMECVQVDHAVEAPDEYTQAKSMIEAS